MLFDRNLSRKTENVNIESQYILFLHCCQTWNFIDMKRNNFLYRYARSKAHHIENYEYLIECRGMILIQYYLQNQGTELSFYSNNQNAVKKKIIWN